MKKLSRLASLLFISGLAGCAHPYTLDPLGGKPEYLNGLALSTVASPKCVFQAGYEYSNPLEMLVKIRVTNKEKSAFEIDPTDFTMSGVKETIPNSSLTAEDPTKYLRDLKNAAELFDDQAKMESYQGVDSLGELKGDEADKTIDAAKDAFRKKQNESVKAAEKAAAIRKRIAIIEPAAFRKASVKPGETAEGALIFKAAFGETGVVDIESVSPGCPTRLRFMLKK